MISLIKEKRSGKIYDLESLENLLLTQTINNIGLKDISIDSGNIVFLREFLKSQKVKNIVKELNEQNIPEGQQHSKIYRP